MRIAYFVDWYEPNPGKTYTGVFRKIADQVSIWRNSGHEPRLFLSTVYDSSLVQAIKEFTECPVNLRIYRTKADRFGKTAAISQDILGWKPDVVYMRYLYYFPGIRSLLASIPTVLEVNTDDLSELSLRYRRGFRYWFIRLTRGWWLTHLAGMVFVTHELSHRPHLTTGQGKRSIVIGNGIDLTSYQPLPASNNPRPHLGFMGSGGMAWHGVDKIVQLAHRCPDWRFDLIGPSASDLHDSIPSNVLMHGFLSPTEYEPLLRKFDIAIGTMALHRNGMSEASPLKVREYLAYGLPTIIGYQDTDFLSGAPFLLELPNSETNVHNHFQSIVSFVETWMGRRVDRNAVVHLDTHIKEQKRLDFLASFTMLDT